MTTQAARFLGSIPENYDHGLGPHLFADYADDLARRVLDLHPRTVLELAAGTGIVTRKLRDVLADDCNILASDLNSPMLEVAKTKFQPNEAVRFQQVDATNLDFDEARFDVVVCQFGVMFFPDKSRSYAEVYRVLKPGGSYVFNVWDSWDFNPFAQITHETVERFFPNNPPMFYKVPFSYHDSDAVKQAVLDAGFGRVSIQYLPLESKIPVVSQFAKGIILGNPVYEEIVERGGNPEEICTAVADAIDERLGSTMPLQAFIVQASKI